jgi:hypothetical protein
MNVKQKNPQRSYTGIMWRTNRENKKRLILSIDVHIVTI